MWDPATKLIKFVPETPYSDPSYHLQKACHPETGLSPGYKGMAVVQQKISLIILCILLH